MNRLSSSQVLPELDLRSVEQRLVNRHGWSHTKTEGVSLFYRRFLYLLKKYSSDTLSLSPSQQVDDFWHAHILDTRKYHEDCMQVFGYYLHHTPSLNSSLSAEHQSGFENYMRLHQEEFGHPVEDLTNWSLKSIFSLLRPTA